MLACMCMHVCFMIHHVCVYYGACTVCMYFLSWCGAAQVPDDTAFKSSKVAAEEIPMSLKM